MSPTPQRSRRAQALTLMTASVALILSACSSDGSAEGTGDGDDATSVTLGFPGSIGPTDVPAILALGRVAKGVLLAFGPGLGCGACGDLG